MCEHYSILLSAYLDDEVTLAERAWVEGHLIGCADCRAELQALRETARFTALLPEVLPPSHLRSLILQHTTRRPSLRARLFDVVRRPSVWSPALAAGVVGVVVLASQGVKSPAPSSLIPQPPIHSNRMATRSKSDRHPGAKIAMAPVRKKSESGMKRIIHRIENSFAPQPETLVASVPDNGSAGRRYDRYETKRSSEKKAASFPSYPTSKAAKPSVSVDPLDRVKKSIAQVRDKIKTGLIDPRHAKKAAPRSPSSDRSPDKSQPTSDSSDDSMVAMSPPMVHMPEMPVAPPPSGPSKDPDADAVASARPNNPVAETLTKLVQPTKKRTDMDEMVDQLNTNALSTAATARQVKWKFAKYKF